MTNADPSAPAEALDAYRWLEDGESPAVHAWTAAQNAATAAHVGACSERDALRAELAAAFAAPVVHDCTVHGAAYVYWRRAGDAPQPSVWVRPGGWHDAPRCALDVSALSADGTVAIDWLHPSRDGALLAYGISEAGDEKSTLHVRDVAAGRDLPDVIPYTNFASLVWDADGSGFTYSSHPAPGEVPAGEEVFHERLRHHRLGDDPARDTPVADDVPRRAIQEVRGVSGSRDGRWMFVRTSLDWARNDLYLRPLSGDATTRFVPVAVDLDGQVGGDVVGDTLYLLTSVEAPRGRLVAAPVATPWPAHWREVVPEGESVLKSFVALDDRLVVWEETAGLSQLRIRALDGSPCGEVPLPCAGTVLSLGADRRGNAVVFTFTSFAQPPMVYRFALADGVCEPLERPGALTPPDDLAIEHAWCTSRDGTRIPLTLVSRGPLRGATPRPTILYGYGGFEVSVTPQFRPPVLSWIARGGVWAQACLRGGGEFGAAWHHAGRLAHKQNVFDDFHACAEWLIADGITDAAHLAAQGGSNGGLLVGAALIQRPDLFGAVVCQVPLLDMLRYHLFSIARYWIPEYGCADDPEQAAWLRAYSPYHNIVAGRAYPPALFATAASDSRVDPLHARKMVAKLQAIAAGGPFFLRLEDRSGHGAGKPTAKRVEEAVDILSFLLRTVGV